jgi:hypothetical protein
MIRNLKSLLNATMALAAVGALSASAAQAHTPAEFHCHVAPCAVTLAPDKPASGEHPSTTAHQVFVVKNSIGESLSFTCNELKGFATASVKTFTTLTFTNLEYQGCKVNGQAMTVRMNGCHYDVTASGTMTVQCPAGKSIEREIVGLGCTLTTGSQGPLGGVKFHNIGSGPGTPSNTHITIETKIPGIVITADKAVGGNCIFNETKTPLTSEFTTGNTTVTGFEDPVGTPADQHNNVRNDIWWTATVA